MAVQILQELEAKHDHSKPTCPHCGSTHVYGMSRVVGYFSKINNWNASKQAEFTARQNGKYKI